MGQAGPGTSGALTPEPHSRLCSFNIQVCVGATGHNVPQKLREWQGGHRREAAWAPLEAGQGDLDPPCWPCQA